MWGVEKFAYELRGRKFHLITDHKALESIRTKPEFNNNRINRWIEKIQSYDFTIEYKKAEELITADALSRLYEEDAKKICDEKVYTKKGKKTIEGKIEKHLFVSEGRNYWRFDSGIIREVPDVGERRNLAREKHEELLHRGVESVYYELKQKFYWIGMKATIFEVLSKCKTCIEMNNKKKGGSLFVTTSRVLEKVAIDLLDLGRNDKYVLVCIDYFSRWCDMIVIKDKKSSTIILELEKLYKSKVWPEELISDNAKEFISNEFEMFCKNNGIQHKKVSVESHKSNGRVERMIETIRSGLCKCVDGNIESRISKINQAYNNTYHSAIKCTPAEAIRDNSGNAAIENSTNGKYISRFGKGKREVFVVGQQVMVAKRENIRRSVKHIKGKFIERGVIESVLEGDSYLVRNEYGNLKKKRYYDLKGINVGDTPY
jgi:hypothetical protein